MLSVLSLSPRTFTITLMKQEIVNVFLHKQTAIKKSNVYNDWSMRNVKKENNKDTKKECYYHFDER